ncbi:MAG: cation:proton antiporter [Bacillus subtilis]|nr:cation:proton antiporter [Bacillus subtilis]
MFGCKWFTGRGNRISLVIAMLFLLIFVVNWLGGSTLLAAMAMGILFVNLSPVYEDINNLTYFVTPPIFMMFFVLSGAELNLSILTMVGAVGVIYVLSRVAGKDLRCMVGREDFEGRTDRRQVSGIRARSASRRRDRLILGRHASPVAGDGIANPRRHPGGDPDLRIDRTDHHEDHACRKPARFTSNTKASLKPAEAD